MIKTLQKKFIVTAMTAITILIVVMLGAINVFNVAVTNLENQRLLDEVVNSRFESGRLGMNSGNLYEAKSQEISAGISGSIFDFDPSDNERMAAIYFAAEINILGDIGVMDLSHIASVDEKEAAKLVLEAMNSGENSGRIDNYRYKIKRASDGSRAVCVFLDRKAEVKQIMRVVTMSLIAGGVCWVIMLMIVYLLSRRAIAPIAANIERQKQFVTDAGHEIKTPLAIISVNAEAMELYQGESKWSRNIKEQVKRLNELMQNLLTLSRADEGIVPGQIEQVDLRMMLDEQLGAFEEMIRKKQLIIIRSTEYYSSGSITFLADKESIRRIYSILLDNAIKYSPEEKEIEVSLTQDAKAVEFRIRNTCSSLPDCPPEKLFDRFYRGNSARTQRSGGNGIGLSAARALVESYGGKIKAEYLPDNKIEFVARLYK